jgi:hypothetical protein
MTVNVNIIPIIIKVVLPTSWDFEAASFVLLREEPREYVHFLEDGERKMM